MAGRPNAGWFDFASGKTYSMSSDFRKGNDAAIFAAPGQAPRNDDCGRVKIRFAPR
jgi:hypothetical protein